MRNALAFAGLMLASGFHSLAAQPQAPSGPVRSPSISPYLNLANRGGFANPGITYAGIVRPQQQFAQQQAQFQQQLGATNQTLNNGIGNLSDQLFTGRGAAFGYYSHYYYNSPTSGQGGSRGSSVSGFGGGGGAASVYRPGGQQGGMIGQAPRPPAAGGSAPRR